MIINHLPGGATGDAITKVTATWPSGSTCTATLGTLVLQGGTSGSGTFDLTKEGTWTIACTDGTQTASDTVTVSQQTATVDLAYMPTGGFSTLTWTQIKQVCDAGLAASYISAGTWNIGDINTSVNYGSYTGGIQLVHCLTDTQRGSSYYNTDGHIVVQFVNTITTSTYMSSNVAQKYFEGTLHTACNSTIYGGLDSTFKALLEPWTCYVGKENTTSSAGAYGTYSQSVYLAEPTALEVGSSNDYNSDENSACFVLDYYSNSSTAQSRRVKSGANTYWWLRSPSLYDYGYYYLAYRVYNNGYVDYDYFVDDTFGAAPIGCI